MFCGRKLPKLALGAPLCLSTYGGALQTATADRSDRYIKLLQRSTGGIGTGARQGMDGALAANTPHSASSSATIAALLAAAAGGSGTAWWTLVQRAAADPRVQQTGGGLRCRILTRGDPGGGQQRPIKRTIAATVTCVDDGLWPKTTRWINVRVGITSGCSNIKGISGVDIREQGIKERIGIISDCGKIKGSSGVGIKEREIKEPVAIISECVNINGISGASIRCAP